MLSAKLRKSASKDITIAGLWNGAVSLAHAGLLDGKYCATHPDSHSFIKERFPLVRVSDRVMVVDGNLATSSGANSALEMMLLIIEAGQGKNTGRAIREILSCDQVAGFDYSEVKKSSKDHTFPASLNAVVEMMEANIEEPLTMNELAALTGVSRRKMERMFRHHLNTSPSRYYLELRITYARRLLVQGDDPIIDVAVASGFLSTTHFSHCFKDYFGKTPSEVRATGSIKCDACAFQEF